MARKPKDAPSLNDRVVLRKTGATGKLVQHNTNDWCRVEWDEDGPLICHLFELRKL